MESEISEKTVKNEEQSPDSLVLRPSSWADYVGQESVKKNISIILQAAKKRNENPDHMLFYGQAGLGKTTLAYLVASHMGAHLKVTSGPAFEKMGDLAAILTNIEPGEVLFIDEVHRLNKMIEEVLYPAMESRKLHLVIGKGPGARTLVIDLPPFTLIAATTRISLLSAPLRSRFGAVFKLDYYSKEDIELIAQRSAKILGIGIDEKAIEMLAIASRATPRVANRLLKRARDFAVVSGGGVITEHVMKETLDMLEVDNVGLEASDRRLLEVLITKFNGGPVGLNTLAAGLNEDKGAIEDVYEPYLMNMGFLQRTSLGRIATPRAYEHLGIKVKSVLI